MPEYALGVLDGVLIVSICIFDSLVGLLYVLQCFLDVPYGVLNVFSGPVVFNDIF